MDMALQPIPGQILTCPQDRRYWLQLDPQAFNEPGGPAMVYGPEGASAPYDAAVGYAELSVPGPIPYRVLVWLDSLKRHIDGWLEEHRPPSPPPARPASIVKWVVWGHGRSWVVHGVDALGQPEWRSAWFKSREQAERRAEQLRRESPERKPAQQPPAKP